MQSKEKVGYYERVFRKREIALVKERAYWRERGEKDEESHGSENSVTDRESGKQRGEKREVEQREKEK